MTAPREVAVFVGGEQVARASLCSVTLHGDPVDQGGDTFIGYNAEASFTIETSVQVIGPRSVFLALMAGALCSDANRAGNTRKGRRLARQAAKVARAQKRAEAEEANP